MLRIICGILKGLVVVEKGGRGRGSEPQERAPSFALLHVSRSGRGPDRTGAVEKTKGKSQGMWITRCSVK